jgi:large subunit ribosomal protein L9
MRVLLLQDVYKLGRAGDVKKVADGFGRNYLIPQGLAILASPSALKQVDQIVKVAAEQRAALNQELGAVAERINGLEIFFPVKAGETGRLYGSVTTGMIADAIFEKTGVEIDRKQVNVQPVKLLGVHKAEIRLTIDLIPEITIIVHREGEAAETVMDKEIEAEEVPVKDFVELQAELDAMEAEADKQEEALQAVEMLEGTASQVVEAEAQVMDEADEASLEEVEE